MDMNDPDYEYDDREDYDRYMDDLDSYDPEYDYHPFDPEAPHDHDPVPYDELD